MHFRYIGKRKFPNDEDRMGKNNGSNLKIQYNERMAGWGCDNDCP